MTRLPAASTTPQAVEKSDRSSGYPVASDTGLSEAALVSFAAADTETETTMAALNKRKRTEDSHLTQPRTPTAPETIDLTDDGPLDFPSTPIKKSRIVTQPQDSAVKINREPSATPTKVPAVVTSRGDANRPTSRPTQSRNPDHRQTATSPTPARNETTRAAANNTTTNLYKIPELADRYVPQVSTLHGVEFVNPQRFCLQPPFWHRWSAAEYAGLAEDISKQYDPVPSARRFQKPVEEIQHCFDALVRQPLQHASEAARRGESGILALMRMSRGFDYRRWGRGGADEVRGYAFVAGVREGAVVLTLENGEKFEMEKDWLAREDEQFLLGHLRQRDRETLWGDEGPEEVEAAALQGMEGTQVRLWGRPHANKGNRRLCGRLAVVRRGFVEIDTKTGKVWPLQVDDLVEEDRQCLKDWLARRESDLLWAEEAAEEE